MLEYKGKYGTAKVMIDSLDQQTISQIYDFLNNEVFTNYIAIMPDCHAGNGAVIGFTMPITDKIIPNIVGVDIGCGMCSFKISNNILSLYTPKDIDEIIRKNIPFGTSVNSKEQISLKNHPLFWKIANFNLSSFIKKYNKKFNTDYSTSEFSYEWLIKKCKETETDFSRAVLSIGSLGSGNHFVELGKSQNTGNYWFTIHSGSRNFGLKIANYWQKKAGKGALAHLSGDDMFHYLKDMLFAQYYAMTNRMTMIKLINKSLNLEENPSIINSVHNFIDFEDFIIRKGAISSYSGVKMIIPFNMEDGIIICEGKSNPDWNYSAPHGAGRIGSRSWAKENLNLQNAKLRMSNKGIYCSSLPLDESKEAYKDPKIIEKAIEPTATIIDRLTPVIAMKDE